VLLGTMVLGIVAHYVAEAALIRMASEAEETGEKVGLRLGFSRSAWQLFLIDLAMKLPVALAFLILSVLALSPLLLWTSGSTAAGVIGTLFTTGLFFLMIVLGIAVGVVLSPLVQVVRRACGVEGRVEVFKSSLWTLAYRDLRALEAVEPEPVRTLDAGSAQATLAA
jgi:hypothetical protein